MVLKFEDKSEIKTSLERQAEKEIQRIIMLYWKLISTEKTTQPIKWQGVPGFADHWNICPCLISLEGAFTCIP